MQVLGNRSKVLLIVVAVVMLVAVGVSFAMWDLSAVKATNGDLSTYANAKVGDIVEFGQYYQTGKRVNNDENGEYEKTPIEWIVVDKDERTGQLTLMSKYILACGSYFGNWYDDGTGYNWNYNKSSKEGGGFTYSTAEVDDVPYNQAYVDSTVRAYLNNLERLDLGGDTFSDTDGYIPSGKNSTKDTGLLSSIGFSNQRYWTGYNDISAPDLERKSGIFKRQDKLKDSQGREYQEYYYQRPISSDAYNNRPATKGFLDEAFTDEQKSMIVPKVIAGYTGHRWPDGLNNDISTKSYVEGTYDKIWLASATELNVMKGFPWNYDANNPDSFEDAWTSPSDEAGSTVFEYFKNLKGESLKNALKATRTDLATDGMAGNFSIPVYDKGTTIAKDDTKINRETNTSNHYWTRSALSPWFNRARIVGDFGVFSFTTTHSSNFGVRPCVILKY